MQRVAKQDAFYDIIKYACFVLAFYILGCASINDLHPFMFGLLFCLVWCNQKVYILAPLYVLTNFFCFGTLTNLICSITTAMVVLLVFFLHYKFKRPFNTTLIVLYAILSQLINIYFAVTMEANVVYAILELVIGLVAMLAYIHFFQNLILRGVRRRFQTTEAIAGGVFLLVLSNGIYNLNNIGNMSILVFASFGVLLLLWCFGAGTSLYFAVICGLGVAFSTNNLTYVALFATFALVGSAMKTNNKIYASISVVLVNILIGIFFFPNFTIYDLCAVLIGVLSFMIIPKNVQNILSNLVINDRENNALGNLMNRERENLYKKLQSLGEVFCEMKSAFEKMAKRGMTSQQAQVQVVQKVKQNICNNCPNQSICMRTFEKETNYSLCSIANFAERRGKVNIIDVPTALSCRCNRLGAVLNEVNKETINCKDRRNIIDSQNNSKLIIAEQLFAVSQVMQNLAQGVANNVEFSPQIEKSIIDALTMNNILCIEAIVYRSKNTSFCASLIVKKSDYNHDIVLDIVSNILGQKMQISKIEPAKKTNFHLLNLVVANTFDMVFGCSGAKKNGSTESGDTYSITKIKEDKYLLAICDGMGSGEQAEQNSALAISLIENFYKAGFDSDIVLSSVNKLLVQSEEEKFNAIDIGVIDLQNGNCDMYKVGSPCSFIKQTTGTIVLPAGALPLGILDEMRPSVNAQILINGDMLIFVSDGITDSFGDENFLKEFIDMCNTTNPQILADAVLNEALKINKYAPKDDMTILVGRLYRK